jgi:hypothetical protein
LLRVERHRGLEAEICQTGGLRILRGGVTHVRRDGAHGAFEHSAFLERVGGELEFDALTVDETSDRIIRPLVFKQGSAETAAGVLAVV